LIALNLRPDRDTLRQFGWFALFGFAGIASLLAWRGGLFGLSFGAARWPVCGVLAALGICSAVMSVVCPEKNRALFVGLSVMTYPVGVVVSYLILGVLFYGLLTVVGFVLRLLGRDPLHREYDPERETYWETVKPASEAARYFRQF